MPLFIEHRINLPKFLPLNDRGIECDIRDNNKKLVMSHDPFRKGPSFNIFLKNCKNKLIMLNIKSEGIILKILNKVKNLNNVFFLDLSFSEINKLITLKQTRRIVLRFSKYEKFDLKIKEFINIEWIWYDYFDEMYISLLDYKYLKKNKKKICLVSPELLGYNKKSIIKYIRYLNKNNINVEAVCSKRQYIPIWKKFYKYK